MSTPSSASLPRLPLCNFDYVLEVYRLLPDQTRARVPLCAYLPFLPPPLPDFEALGRYTESPSAFGYAEAGQTLVGYTLLAFLLTSERKQQQHHRANGGRKRRRLTQHNLTPWTYEAGDFRSMGRLSLRITFAHDLTWAIKLGLAARRARRAENTDLEEQCHAAFASAVVCLYQAMQAMSSRTGGGWWMREQLKGVLAEGWLERLGTGVRLPPDVYELLRPAIHTDREAEFAALLLLDEALHHREPPPLRLGMDDLTDPPTREPPQPGDEGDAGGTPAVLV
jgi:hypothetical protein